jgi:aminoglycoside phosphotransferase (APT) family kinase protein
MQAQIKGGTVTEQLQARLQAVLAQAWPERQALRVSPLTNITSGWESEIHAFDLSYVEAGQAKTEALVLRLHAGQAGDRKAMHEFRGLRQLAASGYPVPGAALMIGGAELAGQPGLVIERVPGEPMWEVLLRAQGKAAEVLMDEFGRLFARLHRLDWRPFAAMMAGDPPEAWADRPPPDPYAFADQTVAEGRQVAAAYPQLGLAPLVDWLAARRDSVPCTAPAVVHRDFHPGNILLRPDGRAVVIDWTSLGVTDPRQDLAWTLLLAESHMGPEARAAVMAAYERHAGRSVDGMDWFEVVACGRRLSDVAISLSAGAEQRGMRAGAVEMMRQYLGPVRHAATRLEALTGLRLPEIERRLGVGS